MKEHRIFRAVFKKYFIQLRRYWFNTASAVGGLLLLFVMVFFGLRNFGANTETLQGTIIGFALWLFSISAYQGMSYSLLEEARNGTLEQLYLAPTSFRNITAYRVISSFFYNLILFFIFLSIMMAITGEFLTIRPGVLVLLFFTIIAVYGLGYIIGGLSLIFKKVQATNQIFTFLFIFLLVLPNITQGPIVYTVPISWGNWLIGAMMIDGKSLLQLPIKDILILIANSLAYVIAGTTLFTLFEKVAKNRGLLGHY
ncbi:MAG: hypothetical protein ACOCSL_04635 [Thermoplasmatota archaeon]